MRVNGVELCVETFSDPQYPTILLIGGAASSMDWWEDEFCERLATGLRHVIRYDHRDTGRSTTYPPGKPGYRGADLVNDAAALIDGKAHVVGVSMGGAIAMTLAVERPELVESLTLIDTSTAGPGLPPPAERLRAHFAAEKAPIDYSDRAAVIANMVDEQRIFAGSNGIDEALVREIAGRVFDRSRNIESGGNHWILESSGELHSRIGRITAPTLVLHGTDDPLFPIGHGEMLAREIPDAELIRLQGGGHQNPPREIWDVVIPAILRHTSGGWDDQAGRVAARSLTAGNPTGWFNEIYSAAAAGEVAMPWDRTQPYPLLVEWAENRSGAGRRGVVVGCGLGADAEFLAGKGFRMVAFDIAETAVRVARERHPESTVDYRVADLLDPPDEFIDGFDLVVEIFTVQALPDPPRPQAIANVGRLVAPGGTLLVIEFTTVRSEPASGANSTDQPEAGPPWPLSRAEIDSFAGAGLAAVNVEQIPQPTGYRWRAEFRRPG
jgi:pimeloyl-ACP methyl ester carboxylesterase/SAM-dependent methyltransferase